MMDKHVEFELVLQPLHSTLDDDRFDAQARELAQMLKNDVGGVSLRTMSERGKRGGLPEIVLALGASGAIGAFVATAKLWLDRDKARKISIKVITKGTARKVEITADAANVGELETLLRATGAK